MNPFSLKRLAVKVMLGCVLAVVFSAVPCHGGDPEMSGILSNLADRAQSLKSFHFTGKTTGILGPDHSAFLMTMNVTSSYEVWGKRSGRGMLLCETTKTAHQPVGHKDATNVFTNLFLFDGTATYCISDQNGFKEAIYLHDEERTCDVFLDPGTTVIELQRSRHISYLGKRRISGRSCAVFRTDAAYFSQLIGTPVATVEVAVDEQSALPVRVTLLGNGSTSNWTIDRMEVNCQVSDNRFERPAGVKFTEAEATGLGGWRPKALNR